jgi:cytochrome c551/c552
MIRPLRSQLAPEALAWIARVEDLVIAKGLALEGLRARFAEGYGCGVMFLARMRAAGADEAEEAVMRRHLDVIAGQVGVTIDEVLAAGPKAVA